MAAAVYYYGCLRDVGHYLHDPTAPEWKDFHADRNPPDWPKAWESRFPGAALDGDASGLNRRGLQIEGAAVLQHVEGWTALSFWDRSVDERGGSKSVFVTRGALGCTEMIEAAWAAWPQVWRRYTFSVDCPA